MANGLAVTPSTRHWCSCLNDPGVREKSHSRSHKRYESGRGHSSLRGAMTTRLRTIAISRRLRPGPRSVSTDMFIVHPAIKGISSARSGMGAVVPHAAPSGAKDSWRGRCYRHGGPNGPLLSSAAIELHGRGCLAARVVTKDEKEQPHSQELAALRILSQCAPAYWTAAPMDRDRFSMHRELLQPETSILTIEAH